jgi:hypothetical protein
MQNQYALTVYTGAPSSVASSAVGAGKHTEVQAARCAAFGVDAVGHPATPSFESVSFDWGQGSAGVYLDDSLIRGSFFAPATGGIRTAPVPFVVSVPTYRLHWKQTLPLVEAKSDGAYAGPPKGTFVMFDRAPSCPILVGSGGAEIVPKLPILDNANAVDASYDVNPSVGRAVAVYSSPPVDFAAVAYARSGSEAFPEDGVEWSEFVSDDIQKP